MSDKGGERQAHALRAGAELFVPSHRQAALCPGAAAQRLFPLEAGEPVGATPSSVGLEAALVHPALAKASERCALVTVVF